MSFIEKARIALLDRRSRMDQELLKPVPPEKLQEFNNIIIQFKRQAPPNWQATIEACAQEVMVTKDMGTLARAIAQLKSLEAKNTPDPLHRVIESWRRLVVSYRYWQQNIELPEVILQARKWFVAAKKLVKADPSQLSEELIIQGRHTFAAVDGCRSSWPRYRRLSIERRVHKWTVLLERWTYALLLVALREQASDAAELRALISTVAVYRFGASREAQDALTRLEKEQADFRAIMLKKRTCSHCGRTGPLSQRSFAYCGGCRDSGVARADWSRYCSEAFQRAHWAAGHKDECPCTHE